MKRYCRYLGRITTMEQEKDKLRYNNDFIDEHTIEQINNIMKGIE